MGLPGFSLLKSFQLPCGQCLPCRYGRARDTALRCVHESKCHDENSFITLTYDESMLPVDGSLHVDHFQDFMKRLRDRIKPIKVRVLYCGEYGPKLGRPHFHACIFGFDFPDKVFWKKEGDYVLYRSQLLEGVWPSGFSTVGLFSFETAFYTAKYITKKITGDIAPGYYAGKHPEFSHSSKRPALGATFFQKFKRDFYPSDQVILNSFPFKPPRYYDKLFDLENPRMLELIKERRVFRAQRFASEQTVSRRKARLECLRARHKLNLRRYENGSIR